jgi:hypothetical protein
MSLRDKNVTVSIHFFGDDDGLAFSWLDNSLTALGQAPRADNAIRIGLIFSEIR